jgi:hypothetical protein
VRCIQPYIHPNSNFEDDLNFIYQTRTEVAQDETTEQIFSRKTDRKAYRAEVLGKRTEAPRRNAKLKKGKVGKKG